MTDLQLSPQEAAQLLLKRRRARESLRDYAKFIDIPGKPISDDEDCWLFHPVETGLAPHHSLLLDAVEKVIEGDIKNLMVFMPPGSAKSTYGSVVAPTWAMGKIPGLEIILASYGTDLAKKHGRKARQIVRSDRYQSLFHETLTTDSHAADMWSLTSGSQYMAAGIESGITGNRADGIIIDDPVKGRKEADSETTQKNIWNAYNDDILTRLKPNGWQIIIQTRWNENDLSGRILPKDYNGESGWIKGRDGQDWYVICLAAQCERDDDPLGRKIGDYLWPEWFPESHWARFKSKSRTWSALFQQRPQPESGTFFRREWFGELYEPEERPANLRKYGASDFGTKHDEGDFSEHGIMGVDADEDIWIIDWWYGQTQSDVWINTMCDLIKDHKPLIWAGEAGVIRRSVEPFMNKIMQKRKAYCHVEWLPSITDKASHARAFQALCSMGKVHIPNTEWGRRLLDQLLRFPTGSEDDAVDVCGKFGRLIEDVIPAWVPPEEKPADEPNDRYARMLRGNDDNDWMTL